MGISLKSRHIGRYRDLAALLFKYGRSDAVKQAGLEDALVDKAGEGGEHSAAAVHARALADELAADLERLGPTYIKLGQLLSTRADFVPNAYMEALARLQDKVEPFSYAEVEEIVEAELGVRISKAFLEFDVEPLAAASLGQVHAAKLRDGRRVAVKVQRPNIRERILTDLEALAEVATFVDAHTEQGRKIGVSDMLEEFRVSLLRELDYVKEANNLAIFARNLREFELIVVPEPIMDYTTSRVLTMEYVRGRKVTAISPLRRIEIDGEALGHELFRAYLSQILVDGVFHADPHPGNVFLTDDNRIALIDLGMVGHVSAGLQEALLKLLLGISQSQGERVAEIAIGLGEKLEGFNELAYTREVAQLVTLHHDASIDQIDIGRVVLEIARSAGENGLRLPPELTMLGKTLLNLDQVSKTLTPKFNPTEAIRDYSAEVMRRRALRQASPANLLSSSLEMAELLQKLPQRLNKMLDRINNNELELTLHAIDQEALISGIQKVANRITIGIILAAVIMGAALLMRVDTTFRILGYPGLAMLFFLVAGIGGLALALNIWMTDRHK